MYIRRASPPSTVLWAFHTIQPSSLVVELSTRTVVVERRSSQIGEKNLSSADSALARKLDGHGLHISLQNIIIIIIIITYLETRATATRVII